MFSYKRIDYTIDNRPFSPNLASGDAVRTTYSELGEYRKDKRSFSPNRAFFDALRSDEISRARVALKANFLCRTQARLKLGNVTGVFAGEQ